MPRRKLPLLAAEMMDFKHRSSSDAGRGSGRKITKYSVFVVISTALLLFTLMQNDDVTLVAQYPSSNVAKLPKEFSTIETIEPEEFSTIETIEKEIKEKEEDKLTHKPTVPVDVVVDVRVAESPSAPEKKDHAVLELDSQIVVSKEVLKGEEAREEKLQPEKEQWRTVLEVPESCDLFDGRWVYDDVNYPLYKEPECTLLTEQVTCLRNGRRDDGFQKWRWKPNHCALPRFEARLFLERLRGKRFMFVGDSLNRNQWESMVCLVQSIAPWNKKSLIKNGSLNIFRLEDYNATVEFYWAPFLVESNSDDPQIHSIQKRIIMPKSIDKHGEHWKNVDFLVFNSYIWWLNTPAMKVLQGSFEKGSKKYVEVDRPVAYRQVMNRWAKWVQNNVNPNRTMAFFMSMSPNHINMDWENPKGIKCALETEPVANRTRPLEVGTDWRLYVEAENVIRRLRRKKVPVRFVKITAMSEYRKEAHTSVHTLRQGKLLTAEQQADPAKFADCIHWCLPGLPDTWNELLYALIASSPYLHS
ncbi:protein trichome birefringence-like 28 isoform X2 [Zingiber officinale]|uniref:protein trichome birefringence-like 28 isoform X2 n=1 Tax=Zingiber officinale TaxID=94328 RepID=UPI001C4C95DF|nr:protein trichome birefringence-like 28 isoform X2 [Zingiber officinale]